MIPDKHRGCDYEMHFFGFVAVSQKFSVSNVVRCGSVGVCAAAHGKKNVSLLQSIFISVIIKNKINKKLYFLVYLELFISSTMELEPHFYNFSK